ncbi:hypothetical protein LCGC14_1815340 [marine sediment metagenome]|uniref:Uncharacterized protein n=1 Tax=marine sediment metagenome TaxID=412755 RepID=A0A0F9GKE5_9ZZZZ
MNQDEIGALLFEDNRARKVARTMKRMKLEAHPTLDEVAIKLNSQPTFREVELAEFYIAAIIDTFPEDEEPKNE